MVHLPGCDSWWSAPFSLYRPTGRQWSPAAPERSTVALIRHSGTRSGPDGLPHSWASGAPGQTLELGDKLYTRDKHRKEEISKTLKWGKEIQHFVILKRTKDSQGKEGRKKGKEGMKIFPKRLSSCTRASLDTIGGTPDNIMQVDGTANGEIWMN